MSRSFLSLASLVVLSVTLVACTSHEDPEEASFEDGSPISGTWYLAADRDRFEMKIVASASSGYHGTIRREGEGDIDDLTDFSWDENSQWLEFREEGLGFNRWYRVRIVHGVAAGRFVHQVSPIKPPLAAYTLHVTGWSPTYLDLDDVPRVWRVTLNGNRDATIRIDRDASGV